MQAPHTTISFTLNLFIAAAGAGLLSYPFAMQQQGVILCVLSTLLFAALTISADLVLIQTTALFRASPVLRARPTFDGLMGAALGPRAGATAAFMVVLGTLGGLVGYFIILGDLLLPPLRAALRCSDAAAAAGARCAVLATRALVVPALALLVVLPLAALPAMRLLAHSSALGALTVFVVAGVVVAKGCAALAGGGLAGVGAAWGPPGGDGAGAVVLSRWAFVPLMLGVPISVFSLGNHTQVVPLFLEHSGGGGGGGGATRALRSVLAAVGTCVALYCATGAAGYAAFRRDTRGDVLLNLGSDGASVAAQVVLALHVLTAFPVMIDASNWPKFTSGIDVPCLIARSFS